MARIHPAEFLARLPLFSDVTPEELARVAAGTTQQRLERGQQVFARGDDCHGFHVVIYGQVKLFFTSPTGDEKVVELIAPGQSFGEALMFMGRPYIVGAQAVADTMLLHVAKDAVLLELENNPLFARRMLSGLSRRLHSLISDVEAISLRSASQRVIGYLLKDEDAENGHELTLASSKKLIASRLNLSPEHFSRVLHELAAQGLIAIDGRNVTLLDLERLRTWES